MAKLTPAHYRAMRLDAYPEPIPYTQAELKELLANSTKITRLKQPVAQGWVVASDHTPVLIEFTATNFVTGPAWYGLKALGPKAIPVYRFEVEALIAARNTLAEQTAQKLAAMDAKLEPQRPLLKAFSRVQKGPQETEVQTEEATHALEA